MYENNLKVWKQKIQEKRKTTSWNDFIMEIASWYPLSMYKNNWLISVFPETWREGKIIPSNKYQQNYSNLLVDTDLFHWSFLKDFKNYFQVSYKSGNIDFGNNENSDYAYCAFWVKNSYLSFVVWDDCENIMYSSVVYTNCKNVYDSVLVHNNSHNIYGSKWIWESYNIFYSLNIYNSSNIINSSNLIGCHDCIECNDLENKSYCYKNKEYTREDFFKIKSDYKNTQAKLEYRAKNISSIKVVWEWIFNSSDIELGFFVNRLNSWKNIAYIWGWNGSSNFYDTFEAWIDSNNFYAVCNAWTNTYDVYCSSLIDNGSSNIFYSYYMWACSYCLGCIWLQNKSYCIFNKQYSKEEWYYKVDEIFSKMDLDWELGSFFLPEMNPFYYNDTAAWLMTNLTKEEVVSKWYMWRDEEIKVDIPEGSTVVSTNDLDKYQWYDEQWNWKINPEILKVVIQDEKWNYYKIVEMEYDFLMKHELPIPEIHWMDRMKLNFGI